MSSTQSPELSIPQILFPDQLLILSLGQLHSTLSQQVKDVMIAKKVIDLGEILDFTNYLNSLQRWLKVCTHKLTLQQEEKYFNLYIKVIKPHIHRYNSLLTKLNEEEYAFFTAFLERKQVYAIKQSYQKLAKFEILSKQDQSNLCDNKRYEFIDNEELEGLFEKPLTNLYTIPLSEPPKNAEYKDWGTYLTVNKVEIDSIVIHGKGIAKKQLGFPTANLQMTEQIQANLNEYPNGIYLVEFNFKTGGNYYGVCCVGTNPHYENLTTRRVIQTYVFNQFGESDFYGAQINMKLLILMRFEGKFRSFDCFLNAMHNDIYMGKQIAMDLHYIKN